MSPILKIIVYSALTAALTSYFLTPKVIKLAKKLNIIDDPKKHKHPKVIHTYPVPRGGGIAIFIAILVGIVVFLPIDKHIGGIIVGAVVVVALGLADDKYNLNPILRLFFQFIAASIPIAAGIGIAFISNPLGEGIINLSQPQIVFDLFGESRSIWIISDLFALFWIVVLMNFVNIGASGVDGQLSGTVVIAAGIIAALSLKYNADITQWPVAILASITAGAYLGFLPWHLFPQKIMPSFSGATLAGYMLAVLSILSTAKVGTLIVILAVPLIDTGYVIIRRIASRKSPFWGDRGHFHHRLLDLGWSKKQVAYFYWTITLILGFMAYYLNTQHKFYTIIGVAVLIGGLILWMTYRPKMKI